MNSTLIPNESIESAIRNKRTHLVVAHLVVRCDFGKKPVYKTKQPLTKGRALSEGDSAL